MKEGDNVSVLVEEVGSNDTMGMMDKIGVTAGWKKTRQSSFCVNCPHNLNSYRETGDEKHTNLESNETKPVDENDELDKDPRD